MECKNKYGKELDLNNRAEEILRILQESQKNPKCPPSLSNIIIVLILFFCLILFIILS